LEHPTATSLLPLRCFRVVHISRTHAKFSHQGRVGLASAKPDPPSGAKRGGGTPSALKFSSTFHFCPDQRAEGADSHAGSMQPRQVDALLRLPTRPAWRPRPTRHANRRARCFMQATAPPLAPPLRLLDYGTNTATRGDPAHDQAAPAWRGGQCGQKRASSNDGGRRAGAAVTSSAKLMSHPGAARGPPFTA
jgi:hypothetical protein